MRFINITGEEIVYFKTDGTKEIFPSIGELEAERVLYSKEEKDGFVICNYGYKGDEISVSVDVKNIGKAAGKEVVELYVAAPNSLERNKPTHELKAYVKTRTLKPNEKQMVTLTVKATDLASFNETKSAWIVDEGAYHFLLGASSRDIRATLSTDIKARETKVNNVLAPKEKLELLHR